MSVPFRLGLTRDCLAPDGDKPGFDARAFTVLNAVPGLSWEFLPEWNDRITPADVAAYDAIMSLRPAMTAESLSNEEVTALEPSFLHIAPQLM